MKQSLQAVQRAGTNQPCVSNTIGIDLGDRWSRYCILDATGAIIKEGRVRTTADALREKFGGLASTRIVIEAGTHSPWMSRLPEEVGHEVIVANPHDYLSGDDLADLVASTDGSNRTLTMITTMTAEMCVSLLSARIHRPTDRASQRY